MTFDAVLIPGLLALLAGWGLYKKTDLFSALTRGAADGLRILLRIAPTLVGLLTAIAMFRASGAMDYLAALFAPLLELLGIPVETVPLMLVRPLSGSGALAVVANLIQTYGPDSLIGRTAAVMMGSTETTFYTTAVYFSAAGIHDSRHTIPAALVADISGFLAASLMTQLFFY